MFRLCSNRSTQPIVRVDCRSTPMRREIITRDNLAFSHCGLSSVVLLTRAGCGCSRESYFRLYLVPARRRDIRDETKVRGTAAVKNAAACKFFPRPPPPSPVMYERAKVAHPGAAAPLFYAHTLSNAATRT